MKTSELNADVLVAGGGPAGVPCALAAARNGAKVILCQDRSMLGGNASSEVRMHIVGADGGRRGREMAVEAREGGIIEEIRLETCVRNQQRSAAMLDLILYDLCRAEPNITLLLDTTVVGANRNGRLISHAIAERPSTEDRFLIHSKVFVDCTGDGRLGAEAGASFVMGREAKKDFDESFAQDIADNKTLSSTILFEARKHPHPIPFVAPSWARKFTEEDLRHRPHATAGIDNGLEYGYSAGDPATALRDLAPLPALALSEADAKGTLWIRRSDGKSDVFFVVNAAKQARRIVVSIEGDKRAPELWDAERDTAVPAPIWRTREGRTDVELFLDAGKSIFLVLDSLIDPTKDHLLAINGADASLKVDVDRGGRPTFESSRPVDLTLQYASGKSKVVHVLPATSSDVAGPWDVELHSPVDANRTLQMPKLISLSESSEPAVRYFSGTATYRTIIDGSALPAGQRVVLDLGDVADMACVCVNGQDLGVWWHAPFQRDISTLLRPGANELVVKVTNTWHNRLVGDEQEPADVEWGPARENGKGRPLTAYPDWFVKNQPRPIQGRKCFVMWNYFNRDTPLRPAGLLGPVTIRISARE